MDALALVNFVTLAILQWNEVASEVLLVSHGCYIYRLDTDSPIRTSLITADSNITAFDIHLAKQQIFYASGGAIIRTPLYDLTTRSTIATTGSVGTVSVDWVHHHVYWTDLTHGRVEVVGLDGAGRRIVRHSPRLTGALALDPQLGDIFWMEQDHRTAVRVMSCKFDGSRAKQLYRKRDIPSGSPLALDVVRKGIQFYRRNGNWSELWVMKRTPSPWSHWLYERNESSATTLGLAKDGFYYSNGQGLWSGSWGLSTITVGVGGTYSTVQISVPTFTLVDDMLVNATQVRVVATGAQPRWPDDCSSRRCAHQCVVVGLRQTACVCHFGFSLAADLSSCKEHGYILDRSYTTLGRAALDGTSRTTLYRNSSANIHAFDLDLNRRLVYWSDLAGEAILRAPVDRPNRWEVVVRGVSAYGLAVDWLHDHLYWTEHSRVMMSRLDGGSRVVLLDNLDAPAAIAVDPVYKYIFWVECGIGRQLRRADLDGRYLVSLSDDVSCGATLTLDPRSHTIFRLGREGSIISSGYNGTNDTLHVHQTARALTVHDQVLWVPLPDMESVEASIHVNQGRHIFQHIRYEEEAEEIRVMRSPSPPLPSVTCEDVDCPVHCILSPNHTLTRVCSDLDEVKIVCTCYNLKPSPNTTVATEKRQSLTVVNTTAVSVSLQSTLPLVYPFVYLDEVDSLVPRNVEHRARFSARVDSSNQTFTISGLNPATTYKLTVRNRVSPAALSVQFHTRPPPLAVHRLPEVLIPGIESPISWHPQGVHFFSPNVWDIHIKREYLLLLLSKDKHTQSSSPEVQKDVLSLIKQEVKYNFVILRYYKTKDGFDDDPTMNLNNLPWGETFWLAMVQVTEYRLQYNLDVVYSERFRLPDHTSSYHR